MKQYRYLKVNTYQGGPGGRPLLTLRLTKPELVGHGRSDFYIAFWEMFDLQLGNGLITATVFVRG